MAMTLMACMVNSYVTSTMRECIKKNLAKDLMAQMITNPAKEGKTHQFWVEDGLLQAKGRGLKASNLRKMLLKEHHNTIGQPFELAEDLCLIETKVLLAIDAG